MVENTGGVVRTDNREREPGLLNGEFARGINALAKEYPDETRIGDLRIPPPRMKPQDYSAFGYVKDQSPPDGWRDYYLGLPKNRRIALSGLMHKVIKAGFKTLGDIRDADIEDFTNPEHVPNGKTRSSSILNVQNAYFIKTCFKADAFS